MFSAAFSPQGDRIVTASADKTGRVWDAEAGKTVAVLEGHSGPVLNAMFGPDGKRILTASDDTTARIWRVFPTAQALVDRSKMLVPRCLTPEQLENAFLDPQPPAWCFELKKWPYQTVVERIGSNSRRIVAERETPSACHSITWWSGRHSDVSRHLFVLT